MQRPTPRPAFRAIRDPTIAYVLLRNAHFGPRLASSVELCVRDLARSSRYARSTLVVCPKVDEPFDGIAIETVPDAAFGGNLAKAFSVARMLRRRAVDVAIVENHLPAASLIASVARLPVVLHSHAYEKPAISRLKRIARDAELGRISGLAFVSEDCANRFLANFPKARGPMRAVPNGLDMAAWFDQGPKEKTILSVGRALDDKGHLEAMAAITRLLPSRPDWRARFILSATDREPKTMEGLREAAARMAGRVTIETNLPYAEVKRAFEKAAVAMVMTKTPEPFGRTALEALASGAALLTSGLGGLAEVCGEHAEIANPADSEGLAVRLASLMDSPALREKLARAGRARVVALFDISAVAKRMDDFVDEVVGRSRAG
ncbi:MAG TPA: glycosyltransferase family 4 protein [Roseiarcus sp.]|nr:glycosyltransferase family 4 protein [Roseiarcus sp.]